MAETNFPRVVDAAWLAGQLGEDGLVVGDVRGPNAHTRGHIPGSRPLVLGSPPPGADEASVAELAREVALRLRRHGITGRERLVLVDRGDGVGAMPAAQLAELAGHRRVAILVGGMAAWQGELAEGAVELEPVREADLEPSPHALPTRRELRSPRRRRADDPRRPHARRVHGQEGQQVRSAPGTHPRRAERRARAALRRPGRASRRERIRELVGRPEGAEVVAYCHSGSRSALATLALRAAGYDARNYAGSWHEWSRHEDLPLER